MTEPIAAAARFERTRVNGKPAKDDVSLPRENAESEPPGPWVGRVVEVSADWFSARPSKREWLLRDGRTEQSAGVLPLGKVGMLVAEGGAGKTMALLGLAFAKATGTPWLGCLIVPQAGRVLVIVGEEDEEEVRRRVFNVARSAGGVGPPPGSMVVMPLAGVPCPMLHSDEHGNPVEAPFLEWLRTYLVATGPWSLVIIDPLSRFAGLDAEVDNAAATRFVQALESIATSSGATVMVAHHSNKLSRGQSATVSASSARGSTALIDGVRWAATLSVERHKAMGGPDRERLGHTVTLTFQKSNYSMKGEPVELRHDPDNGGALLPLDEADIETVDAARKASDRGAGKRAERDERGRERTSILARAVLTALAAYPEGLTYRALRGTVAASLGGCGDTALGAAIASLGQTVRKADGPRRATLHFLAPEGTP